MKEGIATSTAEYSMISPNMIRCKLLENCHVDLLQVDENHAAVLRMAEGERYTVLVDARAVVTITKEAMEYAARPEAYKLLIAQAILVDSLPNRIIGNFIIKFHKPAAPTHLFSTEEAAIAWLRKNIDAERKEKSMPARQGK